MEVTPGGRRRLGSAPRVYLVPRAANDGWENSPRGIVSGKARLDQPRAVVAHQRGGLLVVTHFRREART